MTLELLQKISKQTLQFTITDLAEIDKLLTSRKLSEQKCSFYPHEIRRSCLLTY